MNKFLPFSILSLLILSACNKTLPVSEDLAQKLENPLYARKYYTEQMDYAVSLVIRNDPQAMSGATAKLIDDVRISSLENARAASLRAKEGAQGSFSGPQGEAQGDVVLLDTMLYIGPNFFVSPGADLRVMLTTTDPRSIAFPDATTTDLGPLKDAFGAQSYAVPPEAKDATMVVLWDAKFKRLFGSAQLTR